VKELVAVDPETGRRDHCGAIAKRRDVGDVTVWLTYDESNRFWSIVWQDDRLRKMGFVEARREVCWELFEHIDEATIAEMRDQRWTGAIPDCGAPDP